MKNIFLLVSLVWSITTNANSNNGEPVKNKVTSQLQSSGISFTENKGQVHDQFFKSRPDVLFGAMTGPLAVFIRNNGVSYQLSRIDSYKDAVHPRPNEDPTAKPKDIDQQTVYRIDINWRNARQASNMSFDETLPGYNNYYLPSCPNGALDVKSYKGITLHNIYNGINVHYYEHKGALKHDYIVAPGANYKNIQIYISTSLFIICIKVQELLLARKHGELPKAPYLESYLNLHNVFVFYLFHLYLFLLSVNARIGLPDFFACQYW